MEEWKRSLELSRKVCRICRVAVSGEGICAECDAKEKEQKAKEDAWRRRSDAEHEVEPLARFNETQIVKTPASIESPDFPRDEWSACALDWARKWRPGDPGAWVFGSVGSGKTTIVAALVERARRNGETVCVCSLQNMVGGMLRLRFGRESDSARYYERAMRVLRDVTVLVLDDVLASNLNRPEVDELLAVLNARWGNGNQIIATANVERGPGLVEAIGWWGKEDKNCAERITSRLSALTGAEVPCFYPGDRRTGAYSEVEARGLRKRLLQWRAAA